MSKISIDCHIENIPISQTKDHLENRRYNFLEEPMLFLLALKWNL